MIIIRITLQYRWRSVFVNCQSATHDPLTARFFLVVVVRVEEEKLEEEEEEDAAVGVDDSSG